MSETSTPDPVHPAPDSVFLPEAAFPSPLTFTWARTKGAGLTWVPLAFQKSFRMAYSRTFYGTGYYIYPSMCAGQNSPPRLPPGTAVRRPQRTSSI